MNSQKVCVYGKKNFIMKKYYDWKVIRKRLQKTPKKVLKKTNPYIVTHWHASINYKQEKFRVLLQNFVHLFAFPQRLYPFTKKTTYFSFLFPTSHKE